MADRRGPGKPPSQRGGGDACGRDEGGRTGPRGYERKFAEFIALCKSQQGRVEFLAVPRPEDLGDDYDELVESLSRLADARLNLRVLGRSTKRRLQPGSTATTVGHHRPLPRPSVGSPDSEASPGKFDESGVKGMAMNPVYAGVGEYPKMVTDDQWVAAAGRVLEEDGPEQFLVNMLHILRRTFGCQEWGGQFPIDSN